MTGDNRRIHLTNDKIGLERRQEILDDISEKGTYLPKSVLYDDLDRGVLDFIEKDVNLSLGDIKVPVFFMSIQRWTEFTESWGSSDEFKDIKLPFITVVRDPNIQTGSNQQKFWNIPGKPTWTYHKVPTFENGRVGMDLYKIPQPTAVDLNFHVRFFSNRMTELNELHEIIHKKFNARQHYIFPNGHPMPLLLESVNDESKINDLDKRKYYVQEYEMRLAGYILDEDDYQIVPTIDRSILHISGGGIGPNKPKIQKNINSRTSLLDYTLIFSNTSSDVLEIKMNEPTHFTSMAQSYNISDVDFYINNVPVDIPFKLKRNDEFRVEIVRGRGGASRFVLSGDLNYEYEINIDFPTDEHIYYVGENASIQYTANNNYLGVEKIEFYSGETLIGQQNSTPYGEFLWVNPPIGNHTLTARLYRDGIVAATSRPVDIEVEVLTTDNTTILTDNTSLHFGRLILTDSGLLLTNNTEIKTDQI